MNDNSYARCIERLRHAFERRLARVPLGNKYCCLCSSKLMRFVPYRGGRNAAPPLMAALRVVGSDLGNYACPKCGCHDRERHLLLYLQRLGLLDKFREANVLHFAPERAIKKIIDMRRPKRYVKVDLRPCEPDVEQMDICNIRCESQTFDFVIANHVLEHVVDDLKALAELWRVLKIGGFAILQTPFSPMLRSAFSDPGIDSDEARFQAYGQEDHVRLYGQDIFGRFESIGFRSRMVKHGDSLTDIDPDRYGVNPKEPLFLFERV